MFGRCYQITLYSHHEINIRSTRLYVLLSDYFFDSSYNFFTYFNMKTLKNIFGALAIISMIAMSSVIILYVWGIIDDVGRYKWGMTSIAIFMLSGIIWVITYNEYVKDN